MRDGKPFACAVVLIGCLNTSIVLGQSGTDPLSALRTKADLSGGDFATIDGYLDQRLNRLEDQLDRPKSVSQFSNRIISDYQSLINTPGFRKGFAERCAARFGDKITSGDASLSRVLAGTLSRMGALETLEAIRIGAQSKDSVTRALAIRGIVAMHADLDANPNTVSEVIAWLGQHAMQENDDGVISVICQSMSFSNHQGDQGRSLIAIVEKRLALYATSKRLYSDAEIDAFERLHTLADALSDAERIQLTQLLAKYLVYVTHSTLYAELDAAGRRSVIRMIYMIERLLRRITQLDIDQGGVTSAASISLSDLGRPDKVQLALHAWVGSEASNGLLNVQPWRVPTGGGVQDRQFQPTTTSVSDSTETTESP